MKINIFTFDYSDSLLVQDIPIAIDEKNLQNDFSEVIRYIRRSIGTSQKFLVISNSIGSIPCLNYALLKNSHFVGVILISTVGFSFSDKQNNYLSQFLEQLDFPIFIIHSRKDSCMNYHNSVNLGLKVKSLFEWYPKIGDHYDLIFKNRTKFLSKLKFFVNLIDSNFKIYNENKDNCNDLKSNKNMSFKFEDNFILPQYDIDMNEKRERKNSTTYKFTNFNSRAINYKSCEDLLNLNERKLLFYNQNDNNALLKSYCTSTKDESNLNKPSPFSKKGDSFIMN